MVIIRMVIPRRVSAVTPLTMIAPVFLWCMLFLRATQAATPSDTLSTAIVDENHPLSYHSQILRLQPPPLLLEDHQFHHDNHDDEHHHRRTATTAAPPTTTTTTTATSFAVKCRMTIIDYLFPTVYDEQAFKSQVIGCIPLDYSTFEELDLVLPLEFSNSTDLAHLWVEHKHGIQQGTLLLQIESVTLSSDSELLNVLQEAVYSLLVLPDTGNTQHRRQLLVATPPPPTVGEKSVYIVRVSTIDSSPTYSLEELSQRLFDSSQETTISPSFPSQYAACSANQLIWTYAGGYDVTIDAPIASFLTGMQLVVLAESYLRQALQVSSVATLADRVLFCVAPGTSVGWIASASVNHWRAVFNDEWCLSLSGTMHEMGHTLGLLHSGEAGNKYGDQTGYMGYGSKSDSTPLKCFNGYHSWQLGWYSSHTLAVNSSTTPGRYNLAGIVEYPKAKENDFVVIIVDDTYFLQYNLATSFNIDSGEKRDQVTITVYGDGSTDTLIGLSPGDVFTIDNYQNSGQSLVIAACAVRAVENTAMSMIVAVGMGQSYCGAEASRDELLQCVGSHSSCSQHSDCCDMDRCLASSVADETVCSACRLATTQCADSSECCEGLTCDGGICTNAATVTQIPLAIVTTAESNEQEEATSEAVEATPPPSPQQQEVLGRNGCVAEKMFCESDDSCCGDLRCIELRLPKCRPCRAEYGRCDKASDCCGDLLCFAGYCRDWFNW